MHIRNTALAVCVVILAGWASLARACPWCSPAVWTYSEEMGRYDVVAIARVVPPRKGTAASAIDTSFEIIQVLKGKGLAKKLPDDIQIAGLLTARTGDWYLLLGAGAPAIRWSVLDSASRPISAYLQGLLRLPQEGPQRLAFYYKHLHSADPMIEADAYQEFAFVPYAELKQIKGLMNHDRLVAWIQDAQTPANRRRLYFTMLGICGSQRDLPMLERLIQSQRREDKRGLEALLACYLTLRGAAGLQLIDELYLSNRAADYAETYSAIMAIRFHLEDERTIDKQSLVDLLRLMLKRPALADLVVHDLAKAEDWTVIDRLMELFREEDPKESWVRVPVVNYLRACPLPRAKDYLLECKTIDPEAVKRAYEFFEVEPGVRRK